MSGFSYFPHTQEDIKGMLERIGIKSIDDLYADVPQQYIYKGEYDIPKTMSEVELRNYFNYLAESNKRLKIFVGAGAYNHFCPSVVPYLCSRSEFITAYTPYQAEIAQGTLRYIFEFQSMICALTGLDLSNASLYDGPTAAAEAMMMAIASTKRKNTILMSSLLLPNVREVVETYAKYKNINIEYIAAKDGLLDMENLKAKMATGDVSAAILPSINRYGLVEDYTGVADVLHEQKAIFIMYSDPSTLAVVKSPAEWGADIAVGDAQSLGLPLAFGGPYIGFIACRNEFTRKLPGRVVGTTQDRDGKRCFVLTLQAREQHIKREKATSNICSNQSLMALYVTIYMSLMGEKGLKEVNNLCYGGASYLYEGLIATGKFTPVFENKNFIKEFVLKSDIQSEKLQKLLLDKGFFAALQTEEGYFSFCVTEQNSKEQIDELINIIKEI